MKGFILLCMFMAMLTLYMEIGNQIHGIQYGYTEYQVTRLGCPEHSDARWCPIYDLWVILPVTIGILGVMVFLMYVIVTDILLSRRQRIENQ